MELQASEVSPFKWREPATKRAPPRRRLRNTHWEPYKDRIMALRTQGFTAKEIHKQLAERHGFLVDETSLRRKLREWQPKNKMQVQGVLQSCPMVRSTTLYGTPKPALATTRPQGLPSAKTPVVDDTDTFRQQLISSIASRPPRASRPVTLELYSWITNRIKYCFNIFRCTKCPKTFPFAWALRHHLHDVHFGGAPQLTTCKGCETSFGDWEEWFSHDMRCRAARFTCRGKLAPFSGGGHWGCGQKFTLAGDLVVHLRTTKGEECLRPLLREEKDRRSCTRQELVHLRQLNIGYDDPLAPEDYNDFIIMLGGIYREGCKDYTRLFEATDDIITAMRIPFDDWPLCLDSEVILPTKYHMDDFNRLNFQIPFSTLNSTPVAAQLSTQSSLSQTVGSETTHLATPQEIYTDLQNPSDREKADSALPKPIYQTSPHTDSQFIPTSSQLLVPRPLRLPCLPSTTSHSSTRWTNPEHRRDVVTDDKLRDYIVNFNSYVRPSNLLLRGWGRKTSYPERTVRLVHQPSAGGLNLGLKRSKRQARNICDSCTFAEKK